MSARWVGSIVGGAVVGVLAVGAASWIARDDPKTSVASPASGPVGGSLVRSITVSGDGKVKVKPDTASLSIGVQATASTATEALNQANLSMSALIGALKGAGISDNDITTSGLSIYPQYGSKNNAITGYQASNNVTVTIRDITTVGRLIDVAASAAGDSITIGGVSFFVDDTEALRTEALHFIDCVANSKPPITDGGAGLRVVRILEAASLSMADRGRPVELAGGSQAT